MKLKTDIVQLFDDAKSSGTYVKICAPMVRYSKSQFRSLVRHHGVDLCYTPMIMADSFVQSSKARLSEFSTTESDTPLIVQFAAKDAKDFVGASKLLFPYCDGVDLNCGCPQRWAINDGFGCALLSQPEVIHKLVREFRNNLPSSFSVSVKIRLLKNLKETISLCQQIEKCGVTFLTVHGRTATQKSSEDVNVEALAEVKKSLQVPLVANGGVKTLSDANQLYSEVNCNGVMAAGGMLTNPALFSGAERTPLTCLQDWVELGTIHRDNMTFQCYHHHLVFMLEKTLTKQQKQIFNHLETFDKVDSYLLENFLCDTMISTLDQSPTISCHYPDDLLEMYSKRKCPSCNARPCCCSDLNHYNADLKDGKYFLSHISDTSEIDFMESSLFDQP